MNHVPVYVLSGFLGSGKTTLLNRLLRSPEFSSAAVIVNEFGEIGLDHVLIEQSTDNVVLLESGCLCCTIVDSLHETLADLNFRKVRGEIPPFDQVLVETTGIAEPAPILNTLLGHPLVTDTYRLQRLVVTVDALNGKSGLGAHPEIARQIAMADAIAITKLDLVAGSSGITRVVEALNPAAETFDARDLSAVAKAFHPATPSALRVTSARALRMQTGTPTRHGTTVRSYSFVLDRAPSWAGLAAWWRLVQERLGDRLLRCKGLLEIADSGQVILIQGVHRVFHTPERLAGWPDDDHRSRIVCITSGVDEAELKATLAALDIDA